jgi:hypothetical protein
LVQIDYAVAPELLFHPDYPYRSGITPTLARNLHGTGTHVTEKYGLKPGDLAMDIGTNDGTLLAGSRDKGLRVLGVEATNIARIANQAGIETIQAFFGEKIAHEIRAKYGHASAITAANMFAHVPNLGDLIRGVSVLLDDGGVFVTESHYLLDLIETVQYDSVYHEHLKYYSLGPLIRLFETHGFTVVDADRIPNYGDSIRVYAEKGMGRKISQSRDAAGGGGKGRAVYLGPICRVQGVHRARQTGSPGHPAQVASRRPPGTGHRLSGP